MYYFAYSANLNSEIMTKLCPSAMAIASARLKDSDFFVDSSGLPNIREKIGSFVYGVIYKLSNKDIDKLNPEKLKKLKYSHVEILRNPISKKLEECDFAKKPIFTDVCLNKRVGYPMGSVLQDVFYGALEFKIPETYIDYTQRFYAQHIFLYSRLLAAYENDFAMKYFGFRKIGLAFTEGRYKKVENKKNTYLENIMEGGNKIMGCLYKINDFNALSHLDGIFANRRLYRRYPIRIAYGENKAIRAWCYFKEKSKNLGVLEIME